MPSLFSLWAYLCGEGGKTAQFYTDKGKNETRVAVYAELPANQLCAALYFIPAAGGCQEYTLYPCGHCRCFLL